MAHKPEQVLLTNMCMIYDDKNHILVQDRKKSWCGIAFPGGHLNPEESIVDSTVREIKEETGLDISNLQLCGVKQWNKNGIRNIVFLFKTNSFKGNLLSNDEGTNFWIDRNELHHYKLADNFEYMLQVFENDAISEHYHISTEGNKKDFLK